MEGFVASIVLGGVVYIHLERVIVLTPRDLSCLHSHLPGGSVLGNKIALGKKHKEHK